MTKATKKVERAKVAKVEGDWGAAAIDLGKETKAGKEAASYARSARRKMRRLGRQGADKWPK